jgi:hypothetical protein
MSSLDALVKVLILVSKFSSKSGVIIAKTKLKAYIFKIKFLLVNSLTNALRALVSNTL